MRRPLQHEPAPFFEQVAAPVGGLNLAADRVRQCHFGNLAREICSLGRPIAKTGTETMDGEVSPAHPSQQHRYAMLLSGRPGLAPEKIGCSAAIEFSSAAFLISLRIASARSHSGTRRSFHPFIRTAGIATCRISPDQIDLQPCNNPRAPLTSAVQRWLRSLGALPVVERTPEPPPDVDELIAEQV
jgi:hypothetical protein